MIRIMGQAPRPRRRGFSPGKRPPGEKEYYYSLGAIILVKIVLFVFLWVLFASSIRVMRTSFRGISQTWRFAFPVFIGAVALYIGYHIVKSIKEIMRRPKGPSLKP